MHYAKIATLVLFVRLCFGSPDSSACPPSSGADPVSMEWGPCGISTNESLFLTRNNNIIENYCDCRNGVVEEDDGGDLSCANVTQDCSLSLSCYRQYLLQQVELFGPLVVSGTSQECIDLQNDLYQKALTATNDCIQLNCNKGGCSSSLIARACSNMSVLYSQWNPSVRRQEYITPTNFSAQNFTLENLLLVKNAISSLTLLPKEEVLVLFTSMSNTSVRVSAPFSNLTSGQLAALIVSNRTIQDTYRPAPPPYCYQVHENARRYPKPDDSCLNAFPQSIATECDPVACDCLGYGKIADDVCSIRDDQTPSDGLRCYQKLIACQNGTFMTYMRGTPSCKSAYDQRTEQYYYDQCMLVQCISDVSRLRPQSEVEGICRAVQSYAVSIPSYGQAGLQYSPTPTPSASTAPPPVPPSTTTSPSATPTAPSPSSTAPVRSNNTSGSTPSDDTSGPSNAVVGAIVAGVCLLIILISVILIKRSRVQNGFGLVETEMHDEPAAAKGNHTYFNIKDI